MLKPTSILSVVDHKLDNNKVVSILGQATRDLRLRETGREGDGKKKEAMLNFFQRRKNK